VDYALARDATAEVLGTYLSEPPLYRIDGEGVVTDVNAAALREANDAMMRFGYTAPDDAGRTMEVVEEHVLEPEPVELDNEEDGTHHPVVRIERYPLKPMFVDEAVLQLEMSHRQFIVFMNPRSSRVNVLYRRKGGGFGLIEPTST
jgi:hypothetical protein